MLWLLAVPSFGTRAVAILSMRNLRFLFVKWAATSADGLTDSVSDKPLCGIYARKFGNGNYIGEDDDDDLPSNFLSELCNNEKRNVQQS